MLGKKNFVILMNRCWVDEHPEAEHWRDELSEDQHAAVVVRAPRRPVDEPDEEWVDWAGL